MASKEIWLCLVLFWGHSWRFSGRPYEVLGWPCQQSKHPLLDSLQPLGFGSSSSEYNVSLTVPSSQSQRPDWVAQV